jgi:hypothetical protein
VVLLIRKAKQSEKFIIPESSRKAFRLKQLIKVIHAYHKRFQTLQTSFGKTLPPHTLHQKFLITSQMQ